MKGTERIRANGIDFSYLAYGQGPLLLCLHGFPDSAHTWGALGPRLASLGYRVVAPFMRGYAPTEIPATRSYGAIELGTDIVELIKGFRFDSAVVIGHDWGAFAAHAAAHLRPEAVSKLITLAIPHPGALSPSMRSLWRARHFFTFQIRNYARRMISKDDFSGVDTIYQRWSPTWRFDPLETRFVKDSFREPARLDAALGYYWSFRKDLFGAGSAQVRRVLFKRTAPPVLCLVGGADGALDVSQMKNTPRWFSGEYRYEILPEVGHFLHREAPDLVFEQLKSFLK